MCLGFKMYVDFKAPGRDSVSMELRMPQAAGGLLPHGPSVS